MSSEVQERDRPYVRAHELREAGALDEALAAYLEFLDAFPQDAREKIVHKALIAAGRCAHRLGDWSRLEALSRRALEHFPPSAQAEAHLGAALIGQGRFDEARERLERAVALDPAHVVSRDLLEVARNGSRPPVPARTRGWPADMERFQDLRDFVRRYVLRGWPPAFSITPQTSFLTLGSCFASNLARRLEDAGRRVHHEPIGEEVNSTFANRYLLEWVERGATSPATGTMEAAYGPVVRTRLRRAFASADIVILTLGVAACFFDQETGEFAFSPSRSAISRDYLARHHAMRTTTVAENAENLRLMIGSIRRLAKPGVRMVITVSPVPMTGTTEFPSALIADCLSKSTLRLACHEVLSDGAADLHYWPSFEIVRWLGAHLDHANPPAFGADDGNSRHVSAWMVEAIVDLFLEHHAMARGPARSGS